MTRDETIHELSEWLKQMVQHGVPSHSAKRKALATAIALLSAEAADVYKAHEEEHLNIINRIKELQYAIAKTQTIVGKMVESAEAEQVTGKLKNHCDSLLKSDSDECKEQKSKLDLISRAEAIKTFHKKCDKEGMLGRYDIQWTLEALPSADAVQGEWIRLIEYVPESNESLINFDGYQCSVCGGKLWADSFNFWNYCPICGARMCREDGET